MQQAQEGNKRYCRKILSHVNNLHDSSYSNSHDRFNTSSGTARQANNLHNTQGYPQNTRITRAANSHSSGVTHFHSHTLTQEILRQTCITRPVRMNGTHNATYLNSTPLAVAYSFVVLLGLPLNALSLWILVCRHGFRAANTIIMANLAVSDLLMILFLPLRIALHIKPSKLLMRPCDVMVFLMRTNILSSSFFITFISVDRMLALVYPLRSRVVRSPKTSWIACGAVWLLAMACYLPDLKESRRSSTCIILISQCDSRDCKPTTKDELPFFALTLSVCLYLMFIVNLVATARVVWSLNNRQVDLAGYSVKRLMLIFLVNLLIFALFFLPLAIVLPQQPEPEPQHVEVTFCLSTFNCCLDPLVYYFSLDGFLKRKKNMDE
ncbi:lysophosphatidic acid receptor 6-like isoform X1 [Paramormyrops kingsleyae]|uniref:lysophosphatidic acid receptor 6-like isoform X1 n=1 Tax=Paramormyrops kingsleyae TaxID=1676925 RepID=UPI003B9763C2